MEISFCFLIIILKENIWDRLEKWLSTTKAFLLFGKHKMLIKRLRVTGSGAGPVVMESNAESITPPTAPYFILFKTEVIYAVISEQLWLSPSVKPLHSVHLALGFSEYLESKKSAWLERRGFKRRKHL